MRGMQEIEPVMIPNAAPRRVDILYKLSKLVGPPIAVAIAQAHDATSTGLALHRPVTVTRDIEIPSG